MATFLSYNNRLPDPTFFVNEAGAIGVGAGYKGPGFASVRVSDTESTQVSRTVSGRGVSRSTASQHWEISIRYNPMTRDEFDVVDTFLQSRGGRRYPFFVVLPQYSKPRNVAFANYVTSVPQRVAQPTAAGAPTLLMESNNGSAVQGLPKMGDMFTISDPANINHMKVYKVLGVEDSNYYRAGTTAPPVGKYRVRTNPPLQRFTNQNATVNWINPAFRVVMKGDVIEHELDTENTYQFGLELEEIQP